MPFQRFTIAWVRSKSNVNFPTAKQTVVPAQATLRRTSQRRAGGCRARLRASTSERRPRARPMIATAPPIRLTARPMPEPPCARRNRDAPADRARDVKIPTPLQSPEAPATRNR